MSVLNYTGQTNFHDGFTLEELRRLFGAGKQISNENLIKLINQCFNYELVSGKGIRIRELKTNDFKTNTTRTYKIECTCEGGGGSGTITGADKGCAVDEDGETIIADLYDYERAGELGTDGIYAVSLSRDGKLIVDMNQADIQVSAEATETYYRFQLDPIVNDFTFNVAIDGSKLVVYKIETWLEEETTPRQYTEIANSREVYDDESPTVQNLNTHKTCTLHRNCPATILSADPDRAVTRKGKIKVYYKVKGVNQDPKVATAQTRFMHPIYYGYTCDYLTQRGSEHIAPERKQESPNTETNPCFKVYANSSEEYDPTGTKRLGCVCHKVDSEYDLEIRNTEKTESFILGYYDMRSSSQQGKHTITCIPTAQTNFDMNELGTNNSQPVYIVIVVPKSMKSLTSLSYNVDTQDDSGMYSLLETMLPEKLIVRDFSYDNDDVHYIELEYTAYTMKNSFSTDVENSIKLKCSVEEI